MEVQTTEQPTCDKEPVKKANKPPSAFEKFWLATTKAVKYGLRWALLRPQTWRFLMVHLPDLIDKVWFFLKDVWSFFADLF